MDYILLFNDEQFEHLFQGDDEYKNYPYHIIPDKQNFTELLWKFEDFNSLLYEWYEDESKYDIFKNLWKSGLCIYKLSKNSVSELKEKLEKEAHIKILEEQLENEENITMSEEKLEKEAHIIMSEEQLENEENITMSEEDFFEFKNLIGNRTIATKASDIKNYLKLEEEYFVTLVQTINEYKEYFEKSNIDNNKVISKNLDNISNKLIEESLPLIKDYINEKYPNLNASAKIQLETKMQKRLRNELLKEIVHDKGKTKNEVGFKIVSTLTEVINQAKVMNKFIKAPGVEESIYLATSFLNLATSIKTYYDDIYEYDENNKKYTEKLERVHNNFEKHKNELDLLDVNDYEGSLKKLYIIGNKIDQDKKDCSNIIKEIENEEKTAGDKEKKSKIATITSTGIATVIGIGTVIFTAGIGAVIGAVGAGVNAVACGINVARFVKLLNQLKKYKDTKEKEREYYAKINKALIEGYAKKKDEIRNAYIHKYAPKNI